MEMSVPTGSHGDAPRRSAKRGVEPRCAEADGEEGERPFAKHPERREASRSAAEGRRGAP